MPVDGGKGIPFLYSVGTVIGFAIHFIPMLSLNLKHQYWVRETKIYTYIISKQHSLVSKCEGIETPIGFPGSRTVP